MPNELLLDIRKLADYQDDVETRLGEIFDIFNSDRTSPLLGLLSHSTKKRNYISRVTFNAALKPHLSVFSDLSAREIFNITAPYITAFQNRARLNKLDMKITNPVMFRAMFILFPEIAQRVQDKFGKNYTVENFETVMTPMFSGLKASIFRSPGNSASTFSKHFSDALKSQFSV